MQTFFLLPVQVVARLKTAFQKLVLLKRHLQALLQHPHKPRAQPHGFLRPHLGFCTLLKSTNHSLVT